jgi:MFS transporter, DHA1 family, tetracycline resistance protein
MDEQKGSQVDRRVLLLLLGVVLAAFTGQQLLVPVLAPLSRELRLGEVQLGFVITTAAVVFTLSSLFWGRVCDRWGSTFIAGPLIGTALYAVGPAVPVVLSGLLCVAACALLVRPVRQAAPGAEAPVPE